jgi:hypothetical protein
VNIQLTQFDEFNALELPTAYNKIYDDQATQAFSPSNSSSDYPFKVDDSEQPRERQGKLRWVLKVLDAPIQMLFFISLPHAP